MYSKNKNFTKNLFLFLSKKGAKMLLQTALHASTTQAFFMCEVARYQELKSSNQSFAVT